MFEYYWVDLAGKFRCPDTKVVICPDDLSDAAEEVGPPPGERARSPDRKKRKRRRKKKKRDAVPSLPTVAGKDWSKDLKVGSLVLFPGEYPIVYRVSKVERRYVSNADMWNHPSLHSELGLKEGDEYSPFCYLTPSLDLFGVGSPNVGSRSADGSAIVLVDAQFLSWVEERLSEVKKLLR